MFTVVVIAVAASVFVMYFRHERQLRRKRRAELAAGVNQLSKPDRDPR